MVKKEYLAFSHLEINSIIFQQKSRIIKEGLYILGAK